jgi:Tfp pilus tip-associated adhesin PilY1
MVAIVSPSAVPVYAEVSDHTMSEFTSAPISLIQSAVSPQVIINSSKDHQLFFKAYNDYADLDNDGQPETTYKHSIDYYGYFDSYKCYSYDAVDKRFEPAAFTADKYCTGANDGYWSGNFLNWASMTRIDAIRKILFGGHRRVDTSTDTVLERAFIPPDIHAFAKFYDGSDVNDLVPFTVNTSEPTGTGTPVTAGTSTTNISIGTGSKSFATQSGSWVKVGDYVKVVSAANPANYMQGQVTAFDSNDGNPLTVNVTAIGGGGTFNSWNIIKLFGTGTFSFNTNQAGAWVKIGDYMTIADPANAANYMQGWVTAFDSSDGNPLTVNVTRTGGSAMPASWNLTNHTRTGITLCNVTYSATAGIFSQEVTDPPLIRAAAGNYSFWSSGEVTQCLWDEEESDAGHGLNYNNPYYSEIYAAQDNPTRAAVGLGIYDYVVRVQVCKDADGDDVLDLASGTEKCKQYPYKNFKPIGLLQIYGENPDTPLLFGMVAGTYGKSRRGGEIVQKVANADEMDGMCREINLGLDCNGDGDVDGGTDVGYVNQDDWVDATHHIGDGTFKRVHTAAGGPINQAVKSEGVINTWSLYRIYGYKYGSGNWNYNTTSSGGDKCPLSINFFGDASDSECHNWGNPFAEIYLSGLRYFAGENAPTDYQSGDGQFITGINYNTGVWLDPLTSENYCARLNVVNFNSSVISADTVFTSDPATVKDELDTNSFGVVPDLDSSRNTRQLTEIIGRVEGIYPDPADPSKKWFVGETAADKNRKCTAKAITNLGEVRGLCPEGPDLRGGFRVAGLAWYSHVNDIRPDTLTGNRALEGVQKVDSYAVRLAAGNPVIEIPVPGSPNDKVTLLPSCIDNDKSDYGCTLVDFKIVKQHTEVGGVGTGKFLVIWEDSLQGNDYDLDAGGIIEYSITSTNITIKTAITLQNLGYSIGHGFVISGTTEDGLHIFSGTNDFVYDDPLSGVTDCPATSKCNMGDGVRQETFTLGSATAGLLEDPLWYAAKWGGFEDMNDNDLPDLTEEWDKKINASGETGSDGIPDNYYYASNPQELETSLNRVFLSILERTSSGTAAAVVSNNVRGEGALYQAYYEPLKKDMDGRQASWIGTVHALWLDRFGFSRQDCRGTDNIAAGECTPNGLLDNYDIDQVVQTFFDETENRTRVKVYTSDDPDSFDPFFMEGVVSDYDAGEVTLEPYSMEGIVSSYDTRHMTINPYSMTGTVTAYDSVTGAVTLDIQNGTLQGVAGTVFANWQVYDQTSSISARSTSSVVLADGGTVDFIIDPPGEWVVLGDIMTLSTYNLKGESGKSYLNWHVECLSSPGDSTASQSITLANSGEKEFTVEDDVFGGCERARVSTFNLNGTAGNTYSDWNVANLTTGADGASNFPITLVNSGVLNFPVTPAIAWVQAGDRLMLSNFQFIEKELYDLGYLWNAREKLYLETLTEAEIKSNRFYGANASTGRHIMTWIDSDGNSYVDGGEYVDFEQTMFGSVSYGYFDVATAAEAQDIVNFVRGVEIPGFRTRTVKYTTDDPAARTMRLGDIINSTPTIVSAPQEAFNILYNDTTYTAFRRQYADRRVMAYVGGNDGLLHAFNAGFYGVVNDAGVDKVSYLISGKNCTTGAAAQQHPLGSEIWAYAPMNLLPHLKWLKDPYYQHVYYVDSKPRVFDARIFTSDADHPNGWGTVMVVGMRLGGGAMTIDTAADGLGPPHQANDKTMRSAFVIFDITNPENEPRLLAEFQLPDNSFSFVYPTVMAFVDNTNNINKWYLLFGSGPNSLQTAASTQTAKAFVLDLAELLTPGIIPTSAPTGCTLTTLASSPMKIIICDTGVANSFMGNPVSVDWELNYKANTAYFGLVGDANATSGRVMRFAFNENGSPAFWTAPTTLALVNQPVVAQPALGLDDHKNKWVYFGTGRYYVLDDKTSTPIQTLYGIKDDGTGNPVDLNNLLDSTNIEVYDDEAQTVENGPAGIATFSELVDEVDNNKIGWLLDLPPIVGTAGVAPATRVLGQSALLGGILFTSVFQPSDDPCSGEGYSRLYGLYYKTGTAYPSPTIFGTDTILVGEEVKFRSRKYIDLGIGMATSPAIHSGSGSGDDTVSVFVQMSTGDVFRQSAETAESVRSGKAAWFER